MKRFFLCCFIVLFIIGMNPIAVLADDSEDGASYGDESLLYNKGYYYSYYHPNDNDEFDDNRLFLLLNPSSEKTKNIFEYTVDDFREYGVIEVRYIVYSDYKILFLTLDKHSKENVKSVVSTLYQDERFNYVSPYSKELLSSVIYFNFKEDKQPLKFPDEKSVFSDNELIVCLSKNASIDYYLGDDCLEKEFNEFGVIKTNLLTDFSHSLNAIVLLTLDKNSRNNVIKTAEKLYELDEIVFVEPNYKTVLTKTKYIKLNNTVKITVKSNVIKAKKLKKKKQVVKPLNVEKAKGTVKVIKVKNGTNGKIYKKIIVNNKTGDITFKKGKYAKKTYKIKLKITAAGNADYNAKTITKVVKIKIK